MARTIEHLEWMRAEGDEFDILVGRLVVGIEGHVEDRDAVLPPALLDACTIEEINVLGRQLGEGIRSARTSPPTAIRSLTR